MHDREHRKLRDLVGTFAGAMLAKLSSKQEQCVSGWDKEQGGRWQIPDAELEKQLFEHLARAVHDPRQWIDVANFAAFLWYRQLKSNSWVESALKTGRRDAHKEIK